MAVSMMVICDHSLFPVFELNYCYAFANPILHLLLKNQGMKIVLIYPGFPQTFRSFKYALQFISKKATHPPLGLLTIAAMLPEQWTKKLVDMNVTTLKDADLKGADLVFISAMSIQQASVQEVVAKCKKMGIKTVGGGPLFTSAYETFMNVDHLVLNEYTGIMGS